ncbi:MAG: hypothetical protein IGR76_04645, partial [Synechococcales cyanobacterium T60_A2020_003]|nr:hypothetical protein [Synechococcales cyanobacterium T60_A2020_003]
MALMVCPGIHSADDTAGFLTGIARSPQACCVVPGDRLPVYSPHHVFEFLNTIWPEPSTAEPLG